MKPQDTSRRTYDDLVCFACGEAEDPEYHECTGPQNTQKEQS